MAAAIVLAAWLTGGGLVRALIVAAVFFLVATLWSWRRWRERLRAQETQNADAVETRR
jgi:membrane protein implicated in regulation of membrane protease activity